MKIVPASFILVITIFKINAQSIYFPPTTGNTWETISPQSLNWCQNKIDSLYSYLDDNNTKAFILLKDGKIVLDKYFDTHTQTTPWQWASAGKTLTAFMVGIAQQENYLSISNATSRFLGQGWTSCTPEQEEKITIFHQLTMTSGLDDGVPEPFCTLNTCLLYRADAGTRWAYHNGPYTLLDKVIESATGTTLNNYTTQKLKNPTGMTGAFFPVGLNNVFFSNARSMARFGLLILNRGNWNGNQIMTDTDFFNQMITATQAHNLSYGYLWWLNGKSTYMVPGLQFKFNGPLNPNAPSGMIAAMGKDGQFLNVVPEQNLVWVRMGESPDNHSVPFLMNDKIWEYLNELECTTSIDTSTDNHIRGFEVFPNPANDFLNFRSHEQNLKVEILDICGKLLHEKDFGAADHKISISHLPPGIYIIRAFTADGEAWTEKIIRR